MSPVTPLFRAVAALTLCTAAASAVAQNAAVKIAGLFELSGTGASAGSNMRDGVMLAVEEINAAGGILGHQIALSVEDTQTNPGVAKGLAAKVVEEGVFAIFGPVFSGSIMVSMAESWRGEVPHFVAGGASAITKRGHPFIFRTSDTQDTSMPKVARYMARKLGAKSVAVMYVNNDFGKDGRDAIVKALGEQGVKIAADISTESGQIDFSAPVLHARQSKADALFVYTNEEESARVLRELRKRGFDKPVVGESTLVGQKVIDLAGSAADGAIAHAGLTPEAPSPLMQKFKASFHRRYNYVPDHNGIKGYTGVYILKAVTEQVGRFDRKAVAQAMHGIALTAGRYPGILMDVTFDANGNLDRETYIVEVKEGRQVVSEVLPALGKK
jgi:branched-chain amino acid transport system substrate-binding protein